MTLSSKLLPTTVVGSYPVTKGTGLRSLIDPLHAALETAVSEQIRAGIDIISTGQVRGDMIAAFTSQLPGIKGQSVTGLVRAPQKPLTLADTKYALSRHPKVKGILTGPSTLSHALRIETPAYRGRDELILDLAQALAVEARHLEDAGVLIVQIDEPILSTGAADLRVARQAVDLIAGDLRVPVCLHVCGDLADVIDEILKMQVAVFDFEFANNPANLDLFTGRDLRGRMLGLGVVDSADAAIEAVGTVQKRIEVGIEVFGAGALLIDPDCGLRMLPRDVAFAKLAHMVEAADIVRNAL
jgi:5-methyltetrahydropteroyltriglutamate--homocysteine methyltransferase